MKLAHPSGEFNHARARSLGQVKQRRIVDVGKGLDMLGQIDAGQVLAADLLQQRAGHPPHLHPGFAVRIDGHTAIVPRLWV